MESDEVMLAVRLTTAERTLLRRLAHGHRGDVSEVVADALLDVLPALLAQDPPRLAEQLGRFAPCAVTVWLPPELAELLPALAAHLAPPEHAAHPEHPERPTRPSPPPAPPTPCAALGTALRLWLRQDPARLAAGLHALHGGVDQSHSYHHSHAHAHPRSDAPTHPRLRPLAA
ncbi:hypothetical protein HUT16_03185 [Kitasatospora sp. NA04385]|uniref:hypothetical protein n=1 Tax=Kitasatospora sp. NA04385 TaxID=2742135 RepID=UPI001590AB8E|nr:hypothetical protein [Kitasatospora sp. NA04385]QKW18196.1 hypothetical protein HUT16_03185 [Kitasatospora sp. NA04385]